MLFHNIQVGYFTPQMHERIVGVMLGYRKSLYSKHLVVLVNVEFDVCACVYVYVFNGNLMGQSMSM